MMCIVQRIGRIITKLNTAPILYIWNNNLFQAAAALERIRGDAGHAVGDGYRGQSAAALERPFADAGHTVGNYEFRYLCILITIKMMCIVQQIGRIITKLNTAPILYIDIRNNNLFQAAAAIVSVTNYLSALSLLNGRKVRT